MTKQNLVSVQEYAKLCGITPQGVHSRVKEGTLSFIKSNNQWVIDVVLYPPKRLKLGRRPYASKTV